MIYSFTLSLEASILSEMGLAFETEWWQRGYGVVGVDEVGRGCLAGPVVAGAVMFPPNHQPIKGINDSKQLTPKTRLALAKQIYHQARYVGIGQTDARTIDKIGIVAAVSKAMRQAIIKCGNHEVIIIDGPSSFELNDLGKYVKSIVRGDQLVYSVAAASIVAKVYRDDMMTKLTGKYPNYGWELNKGYGTKFHYQSLKSYGLTKLHRHSFIHLNSVS